MILDNQTLLSNAQAIVATAGSTNQIDLSPRGAGIVNDIGNGNQVPIMIQVVEAFNTLTSLTVSLQVDEDSAFGSPKTVATYRSRLMAKLRVSDVAGLVRLAVRFGLVDGDEQGDVQGDVRKRRATDGVE